MIDLKKEARNELRADIATRKDDYRDSILGALHDAMNRIEEHPDFEKGIAFLNFKIGVLK